jgi:hypothetical protein
MVPVKIDGDDPRGFFLDIVDDWEIRILDPLHSRVDHLRRDLMLLEKVRQPEKTYGKEIDPDTLIEGSIVIPELRDVKKKAIHHRRDCKMSPEAISTLLRKFMMIVLDGDGRVIRQGA